MLLPNSRHLSSYAPWPQAWRLPLPSSGIGATPKTFVYGVPSQAL